MSNVDTGGVTANPVAQPLVPPAPPAPPSPPPAPAGTAEGKPNPPDQFAVSDKAPVVVKSSSLKEKCEGGFVIGPCTNRPTSVTGEAYQEIVTRGAPDEATAIEAGHNAFRAYAEGKSGSLYWRIEPEIAQRQDGWATYMRCLISDQPPISQVDDDDDGFDDETDDKPEPYTYEPTEPPTLGRIVHYMLAQADADDINRRRTHRGGPVLGQAHFGDEAAEGDVLPMLVVAVHDDDKPIPACNGQVFLNGNDTLWVKYVVEGDIPGRWMWPQRS